MSWLNQSKQVVRLARSESEGLKRLQTDFVYDFKENNYVESIGAIE